MSARLPAIAAFCCFFGATMAGCGGWTEEAIEGAKKRDDEAARAARARIQRRIDDLAAAIQREPLDVSNNKIEADKIRGDAEIAELGDHFRTQIEKLKKDADDAFDFAAETRAKEAVEEARRLKVAGNTKEARARLEKLPLTVRTSKHWAACEAELAEIDQVERAETLWARNLARSEQFKQQEEFEKARGVLEAFLALAEAVPAFKSSPRVKEAEAAVKALEPSIEKVRAARASEQAVPWIPAFSGRKDDLAKWTLKDPTAIDVNAEKVAIFKDPGEEQFGTSMRFGEDAWEDYVVEASVRMGKKGKIYFNVHGTLDEEGQYVFSDVCELKDYEVAREKWVKIRLEVRSGQMSLLADGKSTSTNRKALKNKAGPFEIRVLGGGEAQLRDIFVKVYKGAK